MHTSIYICEHMHIYAHMYVLCTYLDEEGCLAGEELLAGYLPHVRHAVPVRVRNVVLVGVAYVYRCIYRCRYKEGRGVSTDDRCAGRQREHSP